MSQFAAVRLARRTAVRPIPGLGTIGIGFRVDETSAEGVAVEFGFQGRVWEWRGPAPYHFVSIPAEHVDVVNDLARGISYGWGMVPVEVLLGQTSWRTSLFPKDGGYVLPLRDSVRGREDVELGDVVSIRLTIRHP